MNVFELFAKIGLDSTEYDKGLNKAASMGKSVIGGIGNIAKVGFGAVTAAVGAGTTAVGAFGKQSLDAYSSYEQLVGGVEKLFGVGTKATETLMKNAEQAYKTAGMSSNKYMETATSFSASLLKSLDGDAEKAADITDIAMRAMSDNANTFGTDMESVSNAIMGFSKNNFTMLDNLKLGFAGTKEGMEQLIARANELKVANGEMADLSIDSFADMIQAVQLVQEDLGVAGTTAKEAMTTIEGSANATKAAWDNLKTAIGRGEGITDAMSGLKDAIFGVGLTEDGKETGLINQIIPRVKTIMSGVGDAVKQSAPLISEKIPELIEAIVPDLLTGGISLGMALGEGIIKAIPPLLASAETGANQIADAFAKGLSDAANSTEDVDFTTPINEALDKVDEIFNGDRTQQMIDDGTALVDNIATGIGKAAPTVIPHAVQIISDFALGLQDNAPQLAEAGVNMVGGLIVGIVKSIPILISTVWTMRTAIEQELFDRGMELVNKGKELALKGVTAVGQGLASMPEKIAYYVGFAVGRFETELGKMPEKAKAKFEEVKAKVLEFGKNLLEQGQKMPKEFVTTFENGLKDLPSKLWNIAKNAIDSFIDGIKSKWGEFTGWVDKFTNAFDNGKSAGQTAAGNSQTLKSGFAPKNILASIDTDDEEMRDEDDKKFDYGKLARAIIDAIVDADIKVECDSREFGRLVRKVVTE